MCTMHGGNTWQLTCLSGLFTHDGRVWGVRRTLSPLENNGLVRTQLRGKVSSLRPAQAAPLLFLLSSTTLTNRSAHSRMLVSHWAAVCGAAWLPSAQLTLGAINPVVAFCLLCRVRLLLRKRLRGISRALCCQPPFPSSFPFSLLCVWNFDSNTTEGPRVWIGGENDA